jgi:membrane protein implicated in regulation of membrane protease activity
MNDWVLWLIVAVLFGVGEAMTLGLFLAPFAAGAGAAAVVAGAGAGFAVSLLVFLVVSMLLLAGLRPIARAHRRTAPRIRTGTAALVGRTAVVVQRIDNDDGGGSVRLDGEVWTARAYDDDEVIDAGRRVQVVEIRGATALVTE